MRCGLAAAVLLSLTSANAGIPHGGAPGVFNTISVLTNEGGWTTGPAYGFYGKYTGTAPLTSGWSGTWTGCGGGPATIVAVNIDVYGIGTFLLMVNPSSGAGSCVLNVTDNRGATGSSPANTIISSPGVDVGFQVHNAPGWQASHSYTYVAQPPVRVNNGAGWTPGSPGNYNPGSALNNYQLIAPTSGSCTSASSGGPTGTGASITDGGCTWKYTSGVDYVTATGVFSDAPLWSSGKTYSYNEWVTTYFGGSLRAYALDVNPAITPRFNDYTAICTSTVPPSGVGSGGGGGLLQRPQLSIGSDGCQWNYMGDVVYSSQTDPAPHTTYANNNSSGIWTPHLTHNYVAIFWNDVEYLAGSGGENALISAFDHLNGHQIEMGPAPFFYAACVSYCPVIKLGVAVGEGFASQYTTSTAIAGYDITKGVGFRSNGGSGMGELATSTALLAWDWGTVIDGIQFKSSNAEAVSGFDSQIFTHNLFDGGAAVGSGANAAVWMDNGSIFADNLVFSHGPIGIAIKYNNSYVLWNTIVNVGSYANASAIVSGNNAFGSMKAYNNALFGYSSGHALAINLSGAFTIVGSGNVTDAPSGDSGASWWVFASAVGGTTVETLPGATYASSQSAAFVAPGSDYRPKPAGALINAGGAFGSFNYCSTPSVIGTNGYPSPCAFNFDTPDMIGTARPQGGQYDAGALEH